MPTGYLAVDLGQANDPTAIAILSALPTIGGKETPLKKRELQCPVLERLPLRTSYPNIVKYVAKVKRDLEAGMSEVYLIVDATGVGRPVVDMFMEEGLAPVALTITGGHEVTNGEEQWEVNVPKRDLISALQVSMHLGTMKIAKSLTFAETLRRELELFKIKVSTKGSVSLEAWREKDHDDLVLALAMAAWAATYENFERYVGGSLSYGSLYFMR